MKKLDINNFKTMLKKKNLGMTYVELIVVLSIMSIMSSVILFNYNDFNKQVELKSLSNDIALKIVEAQKMAMSGKLVSAEKQPYQEKFGVLNWRPSYGLFFDKSNPGYFTYFADLDNSAFSKLPIISYDKIGCDNNETECLDLIKIFKDYYISELSVSCSCPGNNGKGEGQGSCKDNNGKADGSTAGDADGKDNPIVVVNPVENLSVTFTRPSSGAYIQSEPVSDCTISSAVIGLASSGQAKANITIYPSGRIQLN